MALPGLFPIYPDPIPMLYQVSLSLPPLPTSEISKAIGITASAGFLVPNVDFLQSFIKGNLGIADKMTKETLYKNFNHPIAQDNEKVIKSYAKINGIDIPDFTKYKVDGKIKFPKEKVTVPDMGDLGLKAFEKTIMTSIFETQKPYFEIAKLVIGNVAKIEDIIARVMPLLGVPLSTKSLKPVGNVGIPDGRPKAIGYQNGKEIKVALAKLQEFSKSGSKIKIDKYGNAERIKDPISATASTSGPGPNQDANGNKTWEIVSTVYSTGTFKPDVEYKYIYIDLPPEKVKPEEVVDLNLEDDDPYNKYKPEKIILGIFRADGTPLNPNEILKTVGLDSNYNISYVDTQFKRADWMLRSPKWQMDNLYPNNKGSVTTAVPNVWPSLGSPTFTWERYLGVEKQNSKTKPSHNPPGQEWQLKKYKKGDKNLINKEDAIEGSPVIVSFDSTDTDSHKSFFTDIVKYKMYQQEEVADFSAEPKLHTEISEKDKISNTIIDNFNVPSHVQNVYLYGQAKASVYKEVNGKTAFPDLMRVSFKPFRFYSNKAKSDDKITAYNKTQNIPAGYIWIDPEADYETKVIRIDPSTNIEFEEAKGDPQISSTIKSFVKNKVIFNISNNQLFNIDIKKNNLAVESYTNVNEYFLENWNYKSDVSLAPEKRVENGNTYNVSIWSENSFRKNNEIFKTNSDKWVELSMVNKQWYYKEFYFDLSNWSYDIDYKEFLNSKTSNDIDDLYRKYLSNKNLSVPFTRPIGLTNLTGLQPPIYIYLDRIFSRRKYITTTNGRKKLEDKSLIEVYNGKITKWFYLEDIYNKSNLPNFGSERKITINYDGDINTLTGNLPVSIVNKQIPLYQIKAENTNFPYGKIIDPSKITNDALTKSELFSTGKYGAGGPENPQEIEVIKRYMLTDLDTESYYVIEGILTDKNKQTETIKAGAGAGAPGSGYYKLPHAIGAAKVFLSFVVDIVTKLIPQIVKLISLFKNPASFIVEIIKEKLGEGFSIFSKEAFNTFEKAKSIKDQKTSEAKSTANGKVDNVTSAANDKAKDATTKGNSKVDGATSAANNKANEANNKANEAKSKTSDKVNKLKDAFKNSPLSNVVYVDKKGNYKFLLDGLAMLPFEIFGLSIPFGAELNFSNIPNSPIKLIMDAKMAKVKNLQDFLMPKIKDFKGPGSDGKVLNKGKLTPGLNISDIKTMDSPIYKSNTKIKNDSDAVDIKYSTGEFINGVNYNYIYIDQDVNKILTDANEILNTPNESVDLDKAKKTTEDLSDALKKDPTNTALKDALSKLKGKLGNLADNTQPLIKMLLGMVTIPIKIIGGIIEWLMKFFKGLTNPLTLPAKIVELLSFSWIMDIMSPVGLMKLIGIKFKPEKLAEWCALTKVPNPKIPTVPKIPTPNLPNIPNPKVPQVPGVETPKLPDVPKVPDFNLKSLHYYKDASPKGKFLIPDDHDIADLNEFFSAPFIPKLPTYTARQFRENCTRPLKLVLPTLCFFEKIINGIIDFIWSTLGIEALIPPPHIKLCSKSVDPDINDAIKLANDMNKTSTEPVKTGGAFGNGSNGSVPTDADFLYDITLDNGTVVKGLNYEQMQKYVKDHENIGYDFKF